MGTCVPQLPAVGSFDGSASAPPGSPVSADAEVRPRVRAVSHGFARAAVAVLLAGGLAACGGGAKVQHRSPPALHAIPVGSSAFRDGGTLPRRFTCDGSRTAPPLEWSGLPVGTAELALVVDDPDAPGGTFVHWTLFGIDSRANHLVSGKLPPGARQGTNGFGGQGYGAPCPPRGDRPHRYVFTLYALSRRAGLREGASTGEVRGAIAKAVIGQGRLTATYVR
jgi:Raf kinase inhibitor-like YbhB/YbcL family protein